MKERPILFSAPMVCAILSGAKTQTRRIVGLDTLERSGTAGYDWTFRGRAPVRSIAQQRRHPTGCWQDLRAADFLALCPYGQPGDRLWVREAFSLVDAEDASLGHPRLGLPHWQTSPSDRMLGRWYQPIYRADGGDAGRWWPAMHMPHWASRILLDVTEVRVERLQAIQEHDAFAEGVEGWVLDERCETARDGFRVLWDSINGERASWASNPWVWVVSFERAEPAAVAA